MKLVTLCEILRFAQNDKGVRKGIKKMEIIKFILENWDSVLIVLLTCMVLGLLYFKGQKSLVYKILYSLVTEAEKQFGGGTGELKQAFVLKQVYNTLPCILKAFVSERKLTEWIEDALVTAKKKWAQNGNITDYIEDKQ